MELTNNIRKLVTSLNERKYRKSNGLFKAEGTKCVSDTLNSFELFALFATVRWLEDHQDIYSMFEKKVYRVSEKDMERMSSLKTPQGVIAVYKIPVRNLENVAFKNQLIVALDGIQDPGNLGTIIRLADWFGIHTIICSKQTADVWNPKVIQATMGAVSRVKIFYCNLVEELKSCSVPVYGTFLKGKNIYSSELSQEGVIVMGNEGCGISDQVSSVVTDRLTIPSFAENGVTSESLNVAMATAITVSEFKRRFAYGCN